MTGFSGMLSQIYAFDGPVVFKGFANDLGRNGSAFLPMLRIGITKDCRDVSAAWSFVRETLLPDFQKTVINDAVGFPIRKDTLEAMAEKAQQPKDPSDGNAWITSIPLYLDPTKLSDSQKEYWLRGLTPTETGQITALIEQTETLYQYDAVIADIVWEEAQNYYNGICTSEEAVQHIQRRVQTYLSEQR